MTVDRKRRISAAFGAAAGRYDEYAAPQRQAAALVADLAARQHFNGVRRILEVGCGTGFLTRDIQARWPQADMVVTDIAPEMVGRVAQGGMIAGTFLTMDGERPLFDGPWFDLIVSSLAFQWFDDLPNAVRRLVALLRPGGSLFFSTMGAESFSRWHAAHVACGLATGVPNYPTLNDLKKMLMEYTDAFAFEEHYNVVSPTARHLMAHLKGIGAAVPNEGRLPLTPVQMRRVMAAYDGAGGDGDIYHILVGRVTLAI